MHAESVVLDLSRLEQEEEDLDDEMDESGEEFESEESSPMKSNESSPKNNNTQTLMAEDDDEEEEEEEIGSIRTCSECSAMFTAKRDLRLHMRSRHVQSCYWTCMSCGAVFKDVEVFKVHLIKVFLIRIKTS